MTDTFKVIQPTTTVYCPKRGEGCTLTGITSINEKTSVMFDGIRYTLDAREVVEILLPNALARAQSENK